MAGSAADLLAGLRKDRLNASPDALLSELRKARDDWMEAGTGTEAETAAGSVLVAAFSQLDFLLCSGGPLPAAWVDCAPVRPVAVLLSHADPIRMALELAAATARENHREAFTKALDALDSELEQERVGTWAPDVSERAALISGLAAALRSMAGKDAKIHRLTAELDAARNAPVEYVITAGLEAAMAADPHREDGTVIRTTDGKREAWAWKAAAKEWEQVT
jgi:hypothetical protein